jgi:1-phosphatidylinositol-3-phosphate 5-kinase
VTSIARHFDRLSEEADKQRARRHAVARSKRARPVIATKVKVQVFDNVRDAFKDESDSDSSEADNEEDDAGSDDSVESTPGQARQGRKSSSPVKQGKTSPRQVPEPEATASLGVPVQPSLSSDTVSSSGGIPISASGSSMTAPSMLSDGRSEMSFTERLQIELPTFETSAPLPSVPATPQLSADPGTADESNTGVSQLGQMSESEMSSGGGERSSILKTLTGLWAFRAGEYSPLEYPL